MENPFELILDRLYAIEDMLKTVIENQGQAKIEKSEEFMNIEEAAKFLGYSKNTLYTKLNNSQIPHMKQDGKLYFSSVELIDYLKKGKRKTLEEINKDVDEYVKNKDKKKRL